jgi:hypothetical protein
MSNRIHQAALKYLDLGWNVMPIHHQTKIPCIEWTFYQSHRVEPHEVDTWWMTYPRANVGIITGSISDLLVLDMDSDRAKEYAKTAGMPTTPVVLTSKGAHAYFRFPSKLVGNKSDQKLGMDIRGEGGYVVAPPSIHETGRVYEWTDWHPWNTDIASMPNWLIDWCDRRTVGEGREKGWHMEILEGVSDGGRNNACASLAGRFFNKDLSVPEITEILLMWNERNEPPLPESEIIRTVSSMGNRHRRNG